MAIGCALLALFAAGQARQPEITLHSTARLVQVNVIVHDKNGTPVKGLDKEAFEIFDNGKRQEIRLFAVDTNARETASASKLPPGVFANRMEQSAGAPSNVTVILLDALNTRWEDQANARTQVIQFLRQIRPGDHIALYTLGGTLRVLHDFTTDSSDLVVALNAYHGESLPDIDARDPSPATALKDPMPQLKQWFSGADPGTAESNFYRANRTLSSLKAIEFIANHLADLPGRKSLVWVSAGFPLAIGYADPNTQSTSHSGVRSAGSARGISSSARSTGGARGGRSSVGNTAPSRSNSAPDTGFATSSDDERTFLNEIDNAIRAVNNANISIYPIDARGLVGDARFNATNQKIDLKPSLKPLVTGRDSMNEMASRTRGLAFYDSNDLVSAVRIAIDDGTLTYMLGFYPDDAKSDNSFHSLKIKLASNGGFKLRYRKGYLDQSAPPLNDELRKAALRDAAWSPIDANSIGLVAQVAPAASPAGAYAVYLMVDSKTVTLLSGNDGWNGALDFLFVQKDDAGDQFQGFEDSLAFRIPRNSPEGTPARGLTYSKTIVPATNAKALRIVVRDAASGNIGSITVAWPKLARQN